MKKIKANITETVEESVRSEWKNTSFEETAGHQFNVIANIRGDVLGLLRYCEDKIGVSER